MSEYLKARKGLSMQILEIPAQRKLFYVPPTKIVQFCVTRIFKDSILKWNISILVFKPDIMINN